MNSVMVPVWYIEPDVGCIHVNDAWSTFTGMSEVESQGDCWLKVLHPHDVPLFNAAYALARQQKQAFTGEYRLLHHDGDYHVMLITLLPLGTPTQPSEQWVGSCIDLTNRKRLEGHLIQSEERLRLAVEATKGLVYDWDVTKNQIWRSDGIFQLVGYQREDIPDDPSWWIKQIHPEDQAQTNDVYNQVVSAQKRTMQSEYRVRHKDDYYIWVREYAHINYDEIGQPSRLIGCTINIDDKKMALQALEASESLARQQWAEIEAIYNSVPIGLCVLDRELRYVRINNHLAEINGVPTADHIGRTIYEVVPGVIDSTESLMRQILDTGISLYDIEVKGETRAQPGRERVWRASWLPLFNPYNEVIGISVVAEEITEQRKTEQRAQALLDLALSLSGALTFDEVANAIIEHGFSGIGASAGTLVMVNDDGTMLDILKAVGYPEHMVKHWRSFPISLTTAPLPVAVRTQQPLWFGSLEERLAAMPLTPNAPVDTEYKAWAALPLIIHDKVIGGLGISFAEPQQFDQPTRDFMLTLASLCAQSLERARLHQKAQQLGAFEEKQRLARELHDSVTQVLFSATLLAESIPIVRQRNPQRADDMLMQLISQNRSAMAEMRTLLLELRPEAIIRMPLPALLEQLLRTLEGRKNMKTHLIQSDTLPTVPAEVHVVLYRIAQESLNNVIKHSHANEVWVILESQETQLCLTIRDSGHGFDQSVLTSGIGLTSMQERAKSIGAQLEITSSIQQGTEVTLTWALRSS